MSRTYHVTKQGRLRASQFGYFGSGEAETKSEICSPETSPNVTFFQFGFALHTRTARASIRYPAAMARSRFPNHQKQRRRKILSIICFPLLALLHLVFILFSLLVRVFEALQKPTAVSPTKAAPRHVGLVLLSDSSPHRVRSPIQRRLYRSTVVRYIWAGLVATGWLTRRSRRRPDAEKAVLESIHRAILWAGSSGVSELSIFDDNGESSKAAVRYPLFCREHCTWTLGRSNSLRCHGTLY